MPLTAVCGILPFPPISKGRSISSLALGQTNPSGVFCTLPKNRRRGLAVLVGFRIIGTSVCRAAGLRLHCQQIGGFDRLSHRDLAVWLSRLVASAGSATGVWQYGLADWWLRQAQPPGVQYGSADWWLRQAHQPVEVTFRKRSPAVKKHSMTSLVTEARQAHQPVCRS